MHEKAIKYESETEALKTISEKVCSTISERINIPLSAMSIDTPLIDYGLESLIAFEINKEMLTEFGIELPFSDITNGMTIKALTQYIYDESSSNHESLQFPSDLKIQKKEIKQDYDSIPKGFYDIAHLPEYRRSTLQRTVLTKAMGHMPYFRSFNSASTDTIRNETQALINFASYNYLGLCHHPDVNKEAKNAIDQFGTSAGSSRIVAGEKTIHQTLEKAIASLYEVDDAVVFVSGYATNVGVIDHLMRKNDLVIHDSLAHNSIVTGARLSYAKRMKFSHNDIQKLEDVLIKERHQHEKVLIVIEGLYSMDGDIPDIKKIIALKKKYKCLLMVDEAHSLGVLGKRGLGIREHVGLDVNDVDIWMGTLSKTLASCGGYIAGCQNLITDIKYAGAAFIFSVGLSPPLAAASIKAIDLLNKHPERVIQLQVNSQYFLAKAKTYGFNTGDAMGYAIVPVILGNSIKTAKLAKQLFEAGINVQSIIYPGVKDEESRLRFFISALHSKEQMDHSLSLLYHLYKEVFGVEA